ncbi:MAG: biotin--[acetyl-CoA-carboxylase] ligase [Leptonema sp. (in: bacteria)]
MITKENWIHLESIDSTNSYLLKNHFSHGTMITSTTQTKGKGRNSRSWFDIPNHSFLFSLLLKFDHFEYSFYPILVGLCVLMACKKVYRKFYNQECELYIKWPNDILLRRNHKIGKLAGILIETQFKDNQWNVVIGIGINWKSVPQISQNQMKFPPIALFPESFSYKPLIFLDYLIEQLNEFSIEKPHPFYSYLDLVNEYHFLYKKRIQISNEIFLIDKIDSNGNLKIINLSTNATKILMDWEDEYEILTND